MHNNQFVEIKFLQEQLAYFRKQKKHYLASQFCDQLEGVANQMASAISANRCQPKIDMESPNLEQIATNVIDFSLASIEFWLQKLESAQQSIELHDVWHELEDIACNLFYLATYIRFTINPIEFLANQMTRLSAEAIPD